ncbi:hypothetical protein F0562_011575 [Nyssa sinensis]|uniref:Uncharacterized protein n=1 Tax=Nyssa sinensis TaxID=561372 RepID=A0A5J4ZU36_9ASTE|nr:hypothetical protein F0562_011575 [Nyssa sinensis]
MRRGEKSGEWPAENQENLGEKLKRRMLVGKRGGHTTPVLPLWRLLAAGGAQDSIIRAPPAVSARKLSAALWELHHYHLPLTKMSHGVYGLPPRLRHDHPLHKDKVLDLASATILPDPSPSSPDLVAPDNPAVTPNSSVDFKGRIGETGYSLKTSTELLKVLNRIWCLEEQHASNMSLVKAMKKEVDHAHARIKELVRDQQADRHELDDWMKQIAEDKVVRKSKEQDRISASIQSARYELEDERKLRKRSEGLHRKLARELYEVTTSLANALKELEKDRKLQNLLEDLCDEFTWAIRDYEQEVHALKQRSNTDWVDRADRDRLILQISELWLDERMQMKLGEAQYGLGGKKSIVDKLSSEIENFLQAKRTCNLKSNDNLVPRGHSFRRSSLESIPLNVAVRAPQDAGDEEDSAGSDSHCFELNKTCSGDLEPLGDEAEDHHIEEMVKPNHTKKKHTSHETIKWCNPTSLQVKFEEQMTRAMSCNESITQVVDSEKRKIREGNPVEISISRKPEICEPTEEENYERKNKAKANETHGSNSNYVINNLISSQFLLSEAGNMHLKKEHGLASCANSAWRSHASPVRQWTPRLPSPDLDVSESSSKLPPNLKENTLKAKLLEARTRGQHSHSRLKASKVFREYWPRKFELSFQN